jgi:hypothetical protein
LINPQLWAKGYVGLDRITLETILTPTPVEPTGPKGRRRKGAGRIELEEAAVIKQYLTTAADGKSYQVKHYNLQAIMGKD